MEFHKVIGPLTDPAAHGGAEDAFHVVCPSLPGFAFSAKPAVTGWGIPAIATAWHQLMIRLGYSQYVAQGGDWGSIVTTQMGVDAPEGLLGIHTNMVLATPDPETMNDLTAAEQSALALPVLPGFRLGLLETAVHAPAIPRLRPRRFAGRADVLDSREVPPLDRLRR